MQTTIFKLKFCDCFTIDLTDSNDSITFYRLLLRWFFQPSYHIVVLFRLSQYFKSRNTFKKIFNLLGTSIIIKIINNWGVEFPRENCSIGIGLKLPHPHNIVLGAGCHIGQNVTIFNGVNLGAKNLRIFDDIKDTSKRYPIIEDNVTIFPGAKIIGPITIGYNSIVGANSVVNKSFPPNSIVAGIPAKLIGVIE